MPPRFQSPLSNVNIRLFLEEVRNFNTSFVSLARESSLSGSSEMALIHTCILPFLLSLRLYVQGLSFQEKKNSPF